MNKNLFFNFDSRKEKILRGHTLEINQIIFSENSEYLFSAS